MSQSIEIKNNVHLERLLTTDPQMEKHIRAAIATVLKAAQKDVTSAAAAAIPNDPRGAHKAVRRRLYKQLIGGDINILSRKKSRKNGVVPPSRRGRMKHTEQILGYTGADRGFILRFINEGTDERVTENMNGHAIRRTEKVKYHNYKSGRIGGRGRITGRNFFGPAARAAIKTAVPILEKEFEKLVTQQTQ
jgi:hypothetical protein